MTFQLPSPTEVKMSLTARVEKHGDGDVPAVSLSFHYAGPNTILDMIDKTLRPAIYERADTNDIPGVEATTPKLRTRSFDKIKLRNSWEEMCILVEHGIGDTPDSITSVKAGDCKVHNFRDLDPHDGGMVDFTFTVSTNDVSEKDVGILWAKNGQRVRLTLTEADETTKKKKAEQKAAVIDGTVGHPGAKKGKAADKAKEPEAGDLFAAQHGDNKEEGKADEPAINPGPGVPDPSPMAEKIRQQAAKPAAKKPAAKAPAKKVAAKKAPAAPAKKAANFKPHPKPSAKTASKKAAPKKR